MAAAVIIGLKNKPVMGLKTPDNIGERVGTIELAGMIIIYKIPYSFSVSRIKLNVS